VFYENDQQINIVKSFYLSIYNFNDQTHPTELHLPHQSTLL